MLKGFTLIYRSDWDIPGIVESHILNVYRHDLISPGTTVLDIGAGIGDFTVLASRKVGSRGRVIALEPNPADHSVLMENLELNGCHNVTALNMAISSTNGLACLEFKGERFAAETRSVARILNDMGLERVDFVKMDVEGYESEILPSAIGTLGSAQHIAIELHGNQRRVKQLLADAGYVYTAVDSSRLTACLLAFAIRHPRLSYNLYLRLRHYPGYAWQELTHRLINGLDIAQEDKLMVCLFTRAA